MREVYPLSPSQDSPSEPGRNHIMKAIEPERLLEVLRLIGERNPGMPLSEQLIRLAHVIRRAEDNAAENARKSRIESRG